jgi:hypothetical protein
MGVRGNFSYLVFLLYEREKIRIRNFKSKFFFSSKINMKEKKINKKSPSCVNIKKSRNWSRVRVYQNLLFLSRELRFKINPEIFFSIINRGSEVKSPNFINLFLKKRKIFYILFFIFEILWKYSRNFHLYDVSLIFFRFLGFPKETFSLLEVFLRKIKYFFNFTFTILKKKQNHKLSVSMPEFFMVSLNISKKKRSQKIFKKIIFAENFKDFPVFRKLKNKKTKYILLNKKNHQKFEFDKYFSEDLFNNHSKDFNSQFLTKKFEIFRNGKWKFKRLIELLKKKNDKLFIFIKKKKKRFII